MIHAHLRGQGVVLDKEYPMRKFYAGIEAYVDQEKPEPDHIRSTGDTDASQSVEDRSVYVVQSMCQELEMEDEGEE